MILFEDLFHHVVFKILIVLYLLWEEANLSHIRFDSLIFQTDVNVFCGLRVIRGWIIIYDLFNNYYQSASSVFLIVWRAEDETLLNQ